MNANERSWRQYSYFASRRLNYGVPETLCQENSLGIRSQWTLIDIPPNVQTYCAGYREYRLDNSSRCPVLLSLNPEGNYQK